MTAQISEPPSTGVVWLRDVAKVKDPSIAMLFEEFSLFIHHFVWRDATFFLRPWRFVWLRAQNAFMHELLSESQDVRRLFWNVVGHMVILLYYGVGPGLIRCGELDRDSKARHLNRANLAHC